MGQQGEEKERNRIIAVMFVARRLHEVETDIEKQTGNKLKIVERSGVKLIDLLHRSDPWEGKDCERNGCILCRTKQKTGRYLEQDCHRRCVVYETWCLTCESRDKKKIEENEEDDEETRNRKMREIRRFIYIEKVVKTCMSVGWNT